MNKKDFARLLNKKDYLADLTPKDWLTISENGFIVCYMDSDGTGRIYWGNPEPEIDICDIDFTFDIDGEREIVWLYGDEQPSRERFEIYKDGEYHDDGYVFDYKEVLAMSEKRYAL